MTSYNTVKAWEKAVQELGKESYFLLVTERETHFVEYVESEPLENVCNDLSLSNFFQLIIFNPFQLI